MSKKPARRARLSPADTVALLQDVAQRLEAGDRSLALQFPLLAIMEARMLAGDRDGAHLANRIALQLIHPEAGGHVRYPSVQKHIDALPPFDAAADAAALRELAERALQ